MWWTIFLLAPLMLLLGLRWREQFPIVLAVTAGALGLACLGPVIYDSVTLDSQVLSGQLTELVRRGAWLEYYEEAIYRTEYYWTSETYTDSKGRSHTRTVRKSRRVFDHWEPRTRFHPEEREAQDSLSQTFDLDVPEYARLQKLMGPEGSVKGRRTTWEHASRMISGDAFDHPVRNVLGYIEPTTKIKRWRNPIAHSGSLFDGREVKGMPEYPLQRGRYAVDRRVGAACNDFSCRALDVLNSDVGPHNRANIVLVGCTDGSDYAQKLKAAWCGGKQNDIVVVYGSQGKGKPALWCQAFGWSDGKAVFYGVQSLFLSKPIGDALLPEIAKAVKLDYTVQRFEQYDYLQENEYPWWLFLITLVWYAVVAAGLAFTLHRNFPHETETQRHFRPHRRRSF